MEHQRGAVRIPINDESDIAVDLISTRAFKTPEVLFFASDYKIIPAIDFPKNDIGLTIFSNKMLRIFTNLGDFKFRSLPTIMFDHKEMEAYHIEEGELLEDLKKRNEDYIAIQLMEFADTFDRDNSIYEEHFINPERVGDIDKLVFRVPENGFPPLFKIDEIATKLFVSEQVKNALEAANIKGCEFEEVEMSG